MQGFTIKVIGGDEVQRRLSAGGDSVRKAVQALLKEIGADLVARAQQGAPARKGKLRKSIRMKIFAGEGRLTLRVSPYWKGRFIEKGVSPKNVQVKGYTRHNKMADVRGMKTSKSGKPRRGVVAQGITFVGPHSRPFHINAQPFMNPAIAGREETLREQVRAAVMTAIRNA